MTATFLPYFSQAPGHYCHSRRLVKNSVASLPPRPSFYRVSPIAVSSQLHEGGLRRCGGGWGGCDDDGRVSIHGHGSSGRWRLQMSRREGLWRARNMAVEVVEVVQALKRTKGDETKIAEIMEGKGARLMKSDLLAVLEELQRQGMWFLAHKVFESVLDEVWYQPDTSLYAKMIDCLGKCDEPQQAQALFDRMEVEGLRPVQSNYTALIGAYCLAGDYSKGIELLREMQSKGITPTGYTYERIIQGCRDHGAFELGEEMEREKEEVVGDFEKPLIITRKKG